MVPKVNVPRGLSDGDSDVADCRYGDDHIRLCK